MRVMIFEESQTVWPQELNTTDRRTGRRLATAIPRDGTLP